MDWKRSEAGSEIIFRALVRMEPAGHYRQLPDLSVEYRYLVSNGSL